MCAVEHLGWHAMARALAIGSAQPRAAQRGYTYLGLLFVLALGGVLLARYAEVATTVAQREKELELIFRGGEISRAIENYARTTPTGTPRWPRDLQDLLVDRRHVQPRFHLRRLYTDPFTGQADWVLTSAPDNSQGFSGVHSRAMAIPLLTHHGFSERPQRCVCDWQFRAQL